MITFRASARTVDMLGRQQIAGVPTAISELFKNAHDAYASRVQADFVRADRLLVVRDDGIGMTRDDFLHRWLVLGTESKADAARAQPPPAGRVRRAMLGEKGIGRLAIAAIGPQVLILTRSAVDPDDAGTMAFVDWRLFEVPGIALDEIRVPVCDLPDGRLATHEDVAVLLTEARAGLNDIAPLPEHTRETIERDLDGFSVDPASLDTRFVGPSLENGHPGTSFYIRPTVETLAADLDEPLEQGGQPPLVMTLLGFTNTMTQPEAVDGIKVDIVDHKPGARPRSVLADEQFFTPDEFQSADHHLEGTFDAFGQFDGTVQIYDRDPIGHQVVWTEARGRQTECGPFRLELAVIQGQAHASRMPNDKWVSLSRKTNTLGGLYIYSDGVRVLPYGRNDYDWLDIERNRTKSAYYYYFSHRNIFGTIEVDAKHNPQLRQKAGREGFAENKAYRQLRGILRNFFLQITADFFRADGVASETFFEQREAITKRERAQQQRRHLQTAKKREVRAALDRTFERFSASVPEAETAAILDRFVVDLRTAQTHTTHDEIANALLNAERDARAELRSVRERQRVTRPRGFALSREVERDLRAHAVELRRVEQDVLVPAEQIIASELESAASTARGAINRRVRFDTAVEELAKDGEKRAREEAQTLDHQADDTRLRARDLARSARLGVVEQVRQIGADVASLDLAALSEEEFVSTRSEIEESIAQIVETQTSALERVTRQLQAIDWPTSANGSLLTSDDLTEGLEAELLALRERSEQDLELAQLGMALEVVNHEFDSTIRAIRSQLRRLRTWAEANPELQGIYGDLRTSFDHLDGYLTLFTPLQRRLYRRKVRIAGGAIEQFLKDLFRDRLARGHVELRSTAAFRKHSFDGFPSTFYPVFVNLVDNALFWVADRTGERWIRLDAIGGQMIVSDSGPGIPTRDREAIFELGFTRKPGGRGLGLRIARDVLATEEYTLDLMQSPNTGATFIIRPITDMPGPISDD